MAIESILGSNDFLDVHRRYQCAEPFPHIVIDNFLRPEVATTLADGFPPLEAMAKIFREPMSFKGQTSNIARNAPALSGIFDGLQSEWFRQAISQISGIDTLVADDILAGGGLHQSPQSGFLDLHVDANFHPFNKGLHRRINLLIYLNREWKDAWGGHLELWSDRNKRPHKRIHSIAPSFNRAVIFSTTRTSWHGVAPVTCPEDVTRKSVALYYYTVERPERELYRDSSVIWMSRSILWKRALYPLMNLMVAKIYPYAKYLRRHNTFDAAAAPDVSQAAGAEADASSEAMSSDEDRPTTK